MKEERIKKLNEVKENLKKDFVGIDSIIDKVIDNITAWYVTPEILEKPVVVSLWGMTGTGKTSLIRKLIKYLELSEKSAIFDCGEENNHGTQSISDKLYEIFADEDSSRVSESNSASLDLGNSELDYIKSFDLKEVDYRSAENFIFVFDEFQHARSLNEMGFEIDQSNLRPVWSLMDHGILDLNFNIYSPLGYMKRTIDPFRLYLNSHPNTAISIEDGNFVGELPSDFPVVDSSSHNYDIIETKTKTNSDGRKKGVRCIIPKESYSVIANVLESLKTGLGYAIINSLYKATDLSEFILTLERVLKLTKCPRVLDCSKSLIFVLGNLDEAFGIDRDINPDVDADVFNEITSSVGITRIKLALQSRFRDEQVGRFGNNIICYPSLKKVDFKNIINNELSRITENFKGISNGLNLEFSDKMKELIYSEGVYPTQGVRPTITTINTFINPRLSDILIKKTDDTLSIRFDIKEDDFNIEKATLILEFLGIDGKKVKLLEFPLELSLGKLRNTSTCDKIIPMSIHEASHSVIYTMLTGKIPSSITSLSSMGGGFMMENLEKDYRTANTKRDVDNSILVSMAGYYGEKEFFKDEDCLMGSGSDIESAWTLLSKSVYSCGYLTACKFASPTGIISSCGSSQGLSDVIDQNDNLGNSIREKMYSLFDGFTEDIVGMIKSERELIKRVGLYISKNRNITEKAYKRLINKYASTFKLSDLKKRNKEQKDYYLNALKK